MNSGLKIATLIVVLAGLSACNTVRGIGKDISNGGQAISNAVE